MKPVALILDEIFQAEEDLRAAGSLTLNEVDPAALLDSAEGHIKRAHAALDEGRIILGRMTEKGAISDGKNAETSIRADAQRA